MQYRSLGNTGVQVSPLCMGTMMFGGQTSEDDSRAIIDKAIDLGINFIDTADMYNAGESEAVLGRALKGRRENIVVATKGRQKMGETPNEQGGSRLHLMQALDNSLRRLDMEHVDIYYLHAPDYHVPIDQTLRAMDDMVRSGKVRYIACSNVRAWRLCEALWTSDRLGLDRFACVQPLYNIVNRDIEVELFPLCRQHSLGVVSYSPLARGILTGKYKLGEQYPEGSRASRADQRMVQAELRDSSIEVAARLNEYCQDKGVAASQFALAWCLANPQLTSIIIGPRTMHHFDDNVGCLDVEVTQADEEFVDSLVPPGEHSGFGFQDELYPVTGRSSGELG
jgi:aryl-alcohol dehydrogenase-like predicted oxidoreductase